MNPAEIIGWTALAVLSLLALAGLLVLGLYRGASWCVRSVAGWLRMRAARQVLSARELRRQRLGGHLSDSMERRVEQRVTETRELSPEWVTFQSLAARADAKRALETPRLGVCDGLCVGEGGRVKPLRETRRETYCGTCARPAWDHPDYEATRFIQQSAALKSAEDETKARLDALYKERIEPAIRAEARRAEKADATWRVTVDSTAAEWADSHAPVTYTASNGTTSTTISHEASMVESVHGVGLCARPDCFALRHVESAYCHMHARRST